MLNKGVAASQIATCSREIREHLGARLRTYYNDTQDIPVSERLATLIERLAEPMDEIGRKTE